MNDSTSPDGVTRHSLSPSEAYRRVLRLWLVAVVIAAGAFGTALAATVLGEPPVLRERPIGGVLIASALIFVAGTVGPINVHWWLMHRYWRDGVVQPRGYVIANAILYASYTATVVILSLIGMFLVETWAFELMAAIPPMLLLLLAWPNGRPMYRRRRREEEDSEDTLHLGPDDES